ncbi:gpW family head-tail joining protein [Ochrobactrum sp. GPK 3]
MATKAELERQLKEAETAYHRLMTGKSARVLVDQNGERIEYVAANASKLAAYITELERKLGKGRPMGPMGVFF